MLPLQIFKKKNVYHLKGNVNVINVPKFLTYFENKISKKNKIVVNIEKVTEIDKEGLKAIHQLMKSADLKHKELYIVGGGCKEIYDHFYEAS